MQSKPTLETILSHRSIRKFTEQPISEEIFQILIEAGKAASSSNHLQCVTVIRVTDRQIRETLKAVSGMQYVVDCAEFLVFCIDFNKHKQLVPESQLEWAEVSLIGAVDTGILAQNVFLAAESLGLGAGILEHCVMILSGFLKPLTCRNIVFHWWVCVWGIRHKSRQ
ncbi:hypothetical protein IAOACIIE_00397 [Mannheimia haemolytica]